MNDEQLLASFSEEEKREILQELYRKEEYQQRLAPFIDTEGRIIEVTWGLGGLVVDDIMEECQLKLIEILRKKNNEEEKNGL